MYYPLTIVDNFFDDFDGICKFADNIKWKKQERYTMPGLVADDLTELNPMLKIRIANKILRLYYHRHASYSYMMHSAKFYKITPYGKEYSNKGWIHRDDDNILSVLIYLKGNKEHGTSFYKYKPGSLNQTRDQTLKELLFKGEKVVPQHYNAQLQTHNSCYEETLNVPLIPNRAVVFDSSIYHAVNGLGSEEEPRILLACFFSEISAHWYPIPEMKRVKA
jgi:hypothetical protein